jgi:hypothetical protein
LFEVFNVAQDEHYQWPLHLYNLPHLFPALVVEIYYRDQGAGPPLALLHGGWGYTLNPFNRQMEKHSALWGGSAALQWRKKLNGANHRQRTKTKTTDRS